MMLGYVDPTIAPSTRREADLLREIARRGFNLERRGAALVLWGPSVHVAACNLAAITTADMPRAVASVRSRDATPRTFFAGKRGNGRP